jgi:hypothetical protein
MAYLHVSKQKKDLIYFYEKSALVTGKNVSQVKTIVF